MLSVLALGLVFFTGCGKPGCIDPQALNYDPDAKQDDNTCIYEPGSSQIVIKDDGSGTGSVTWTANNEYLLDGFVFVNSGQTLIIEPGTVIKGKAGLGSEAAALIVTRGATIIASGTETNPIIFTAEQDDVTNPNDIPEGTRGLWGGVIILGNAILNSSPGETAVEGLPTNEVRGLYGGTDDNDNSGIFRYVSIRYGGTDIGAGNEINGLTLAGVGAGTTIDHVEVIFNADDGIEFFGGTVGTKYMVTAFCGDDSYDYDEGYRGKGQFWFSINSTSDGDRGGEHDGGTNPETGTPYATPVIYNATYIGRGESEGKRAITFRDNAGGQYMNSVFDGFGAGVDIEMLVDESSYDRFVAGDLALTGNVFNAVAGNTETDIFTISADAAVDPTEVANAEAAVQAAFTNGGNSIADPSMTISRTKNGQLNPNPGNSALLNGATAPTDAWFTPVTFRGAFDGSDNWLQGWTALSQLGYTQ